MMSANRAESSRLIYYLFLLHLYNTTHHLCSSSSMYNNNPPSLCLCVCWVSVFMYYYHDAAATACYRQVRQLSAQSINFFFCIPTCIYVRHASFYFHPRTLSVSLIINTIIRSTLSYRPDLQVKCSSLHDNTHINRCLPLSLLHAVAPCVCMLAILLQLQGAKRK